MKEYIASLEKEFSLVENGFKEEEKRALTDYKSNDNEYIKKLAFLAYKSDTYQVRMYGVFLFGHLSISKKLRFLDNSALAEITRYMFPNRSSIAVCICSGTGTVKRRNFPPTGKHRRYAQS